MSAVFQPIALDLVLPWEPDAAQEEKFKRLLKRLLIPLLLLFFIIPWLPAIESVFEETEIDSSVTQIILPPVEPDPVLRNNTVVEPVRPLQQPESIVKPDPVTPKPPEDLPVIKPELVIEPKDIVKKTPQSALIKTQPNPPPANTSAAKTEVASKVEGDEMSIRSSQGLDKLSHQLSALRSTLDLSKLQNKNLSNNTAGSVARASRQHLGSSNIAQRSGSLGIDAGLMSAQSTSLAEHTTVAVDGLLVSGDGPRGNQAYLSSRQGFRDDESIRRTLEGAKSNVYSLYQRALLAHPELAGKFTFKLLIEPDGSVSDVQLMSSELGLKQLESDILTKIKAINFGPEDVSPTPVEYKFVFLPS
ncbi:MAG: AgmX/PglI C-terminal domain-containing protein [Cellvibrionaceae bacterium]|nr:AgmX/PglI C-terminal domain-containing protein [Cellvibrionaceae bacterium]